MGLDVRVRTSTRTNNLSLTSPLALRGHGKAVLELLAEDDVLYEHALDSYAPACCCLVDNLPDTLRNLLAALDNVLEDAGTDDVAKGGLSSLDEGSADVGDSEGSLVWADDVIVDDRGKRLR